MTRAVLLLVAVLALLTGCARPPAAHSAIDASAVAYSGAVVALELTDAATVAWLREAPRTDAQLARAEHVVDALVSLRASLAMVRQGILDGRDVAEQLTALARSLGVCCSELERLGVEVPPAATDALAAALAVLEGGGE